ncbi:MAG: hypothetical protein AAF743_15730, partial [Planctomycetota bacterium]
MTTNEPNVITESAFARLLAERASTPTFIDRLAGNNGDRLIRMGLDRVIERVGLTEVDAPEKAEQILLNGGGAMSDIWVAGLRLLGDYRKRFPDTPVIVGPSTFRFRGLDLADLLGNAAAPLDTFARDVRSAAIATEAFDKLGLDRATVTVSDDLAFELRHSPFMDEQRDDLGKDHVLLAIRKDAEGTACALVRNVRGTWLPKFVRKPLSRVRDRLAARGQGDDELAGILAQHDIDPKLPRVTRDVSVSVPFDEFCKTIRRSALVM